MIGMVVLRMGLPGDLRCHIRTREGTPPHRPHVHVFAKDKSRTLEIDLETLAISEIEGRWSSRDINVVRLWVAGKREELMELYDGYQKDQI